jgi:ubiquinol-cytochrome c reductase iron-sulfur subunit
MNRRARLRIAVKTALLAGVLAFAGVYVYGLFGPVTLSPGDEVELAGIPPGTARLTSWRGRPVWVLHRSAEQLAGLTALKRHVAGPDANDPALVDNAYRSRDPDYGVYLAETARSGILAQYTRERPSDLAGDVPWHGGFVDPGSDALFDVAGRRYHGTEGAPLGVPPHRISNLGALRFGQW